MAARQTRASTPAAEPRATLASLFLAVERHHDRVAVVERRPAGTDLRESIDRTPDWRFHRHVLRLAIYLKERCSFEAEDRLLLLAPLGLEWLVLDWAAVVQGGTTVVVDPAAPDPKLFAVLGEHSPRVALVPTEADAARVLELAGGGKSFERVIVLEETSPRPGLVSFAEALDLGGTLDTAERANAMRALARTIGASQVAAAHPATGESLTHGDIAARAQMHDSGGSRLATRDKANGAPQANKQPVVVLDEGTPVTPALHVALYGYVADGSTCTAVVKRTKEVRP